MASSKAASYAIIRSGGKQYRVEMGDVIDVELLAPLRDGEPQGQEIEFDEVLFARSNGTPRVGAPLLGDCVVKGECLGEVKGPKVIAFRFKRRKNYHRKVGHRQRYHRVKITHIG